MSLSIVLCYLAPVRHIITIICCMGMCLAFAMQQVLPTAMPEMTVPIGERGVRFLDAKADGVERYAWSEMQQAFILMALYVGYALGHFISGVCVNNLGARLPIFVGMGISAIATSLIPLTAGSSWILPVVLRALTGVAQSVLLPGVTTLILYWVPLSSRATLAALIYAGVPLGIFLGTYLSAVVVVYWRYWPSAFYAWSGATACWLIFFAAYVHSSPNAHPRVVGRSSSYGRASFIQPEVHRAAHIHPSVVTAVDEHISALAYASQMVATFGHKYIVITLNAYLPKYLNEVHAFTLHEYATYAGAPFALMYLSGVGSRVLFFRIVDRRNVNEDLARLLYCSLCNVAAGGVLVLAFGCTHRSSVTLVLIHVGAVLAGFFYGGLNMLDMSLRDTSVLMCVINGVASTAGVAAIGAIAMTVRAGTAAEWQCTAYVLLIVEVVIWLLDAVCTLTKMCRRSVDGDQRWYHNIPPAKHKERMRMAHLRIEELKERQRGERPPGIRDEDDEDEDRTQVRVESLL